MTPTPRGNAPFLGTHETAKLLAPLGKDGRSMSSASLATAKGQSYARSGPPPGSFTSELKSTMPRTEPSRNDLGNYGAFDSHIETTTSEQRQTQYRDRIEKETKIKMGSENLMEALNAKNVKQTRDQRKLVESELNTSNKKIVQLKLKLAEEVERSNDEDQLGPKGRLSQLFRSAPLQSPNSQRLKSGPGPFTFDADSESPTFILDEILQALEAEDRPSDYYVSRANDLVELFKRHSTLKYDLAWSIFGLRMQMMLLSDSREVVAAGYRVIRYAITDRSSLQTIRALQTDYIVILSLVKETEASVEREQALKFVRAFLDVKEGTQEINPAVARIVVAVAEHGDDRLRSIAILTLAEMLIRDPLLVVNAGGTSTLAEAMGNGVYHAPETLIGPLLHLMDLPARRRLLPSGFEFSSAFASFTEPSFSHSFEDKLKSSSKVILALFKSWSGLITLSLHDFLSVRSVVSSLYISTLTVRTATLDLIVNILRIKPPSWSSSFIGGRRLTTYGRVTNLKVDPPTWQDSARYGEQDDTKRSLVEHFTAVVLAMLLKVGLLPALMHAEKDFPSVALKRKTSLMIAEVLKMASELLPSAWSAQLQALPGLFDSAVAFDDEERFQAVATVYQVDSVNRTLYRSIAGIDTPGNRPGSGGAGARVANRARAASKSQITATMDETQFRALLLETQVLNTVNYVKWRWDLIQPIIEGPLLNPKRLDEAMRSTKFVHRLLGFLRPFKFRFSDAANTKSDQRYVRAGCALVHTLLQNPAGVQYLAENKLVRQIAECLAQFDRLSGITSENPLFSPERLSDTLVGGYFAILGVMCSDQKGLQMLERWKIINMFYHIVELHDRDDLVRALLTNLDYTLDSHPRIILAKATISGSKQIRMNATRIFRKYAIMSVDPGLMGGGAAEWAIRLLVTQLYDPEIEVCEIAIKILEEACNNIHSLEYVVRCRPALDHLGEIGAPLLLRFLSTSVGYHYLDGLDYITKEMDDWFLGRNDTYVTLVEASLARALAEIPVKQQSSFTDDAQDSEDYGSVPPHFYRELTRTAEGCELLKAKGHFEEFAATIQDFGMEHDDTETILKVKGCLWAVGNVGSMELGASFLEHTNVVKYIVGIAEKSQVMTLRGTAFFVLGLISRSLHGQEIMAECGWDGTVNGMGESLGYSLPLEFTTLFNIQTLTSTVQRATDTPPLISSRRGSVVKDDDAQNQAILDSIVKLVNTVLQPKAVAELTAMKHKKLPGFASPALFRKVMQALATHRYRIPQHRFVMELFDKGVLKRIVLEEDEVSDEGS